MDKSEDRPKFKGFALVTLCNTEFCQIFLESWPWTRPSQPSESASVDLAEDNLETNEATKFGFRTLPKARWDKLNEEYLAYRQKLINELANANDPPDILHDSDVLGAAPDDILEDNVPTPPTSVTTMYSPYPFGCLVFVRNLHLETNKTTLRTLFTAAFESSPVDPAGIDYIDFSKGMDSVSLQYITSIHANNVVSAIFGLPRLSMDVF